MSHYTVCVVGEDYKKLLEPFNENGSTNETYNTKSKWDWYQLGGRWNNLLKLKPNSTSGIQGSKSWMSLTKEKPGFTDSALKKDIDWEHESMKNFTTFAFLSKDGWLDEGLMGWFGSYEVKDENWNITFKKLLDGISGEDRISIIDCHI